MSVRRHVMSRRKENVERPFSTLPSPPPILFLSSKDPQLVELCKLCLQNQHIKLLAVLNFFFENYAKIMLFSEHYA